MADQTSMHAKHEYAVVVRWDVVIIDLMIDVTVVGYLTQWSKMKVFRRMHD